MTQQALPLPEPGKTLAERGPRPKLYAIPLHSLGGYSQSRASKVEYSGWTVTFTPDREAAMKIRKYFALPLSLIKKLIARCEPHRWCDGKMYTSWRLHPAGFGYDTGYDVDIMLGLVRLIEGVNYDKR